MLEEDVKSAASEYANLSPQEKQKTVPMVVYGVSNKYFLIAIGEGKGKDKDEATSLALDKARVGIIEQFIFRNKKVKDLIKDKGNEGTVEIAVSATLSDNYPYYSDQKYGLSGQTCNQEVDTKGKKTTTCKVTFAVYLNNVNSDFMTHIKYNDDVLAIISY